jgi:hypothetical protein
MKTEVKLNRGTRETVWELDLPLIPEGQMLIVNANPEIAHVYNSYINITKASGPVQVVCCR